MPFTPPVVFADGSAMVWSQVEQNLAALRTWLNAVGTGDVSTAGIGREALVRPTIAGWPTQGFFGEMQSLAWDEYGPSNNLAKHEQTAVARGNSGDDYTYAGEAWGAEPERITVAPAVAGVASGEFLTRFGRTLYLHDEWDHDVMIHVTGNYRARVVNADSTPAGTDSTYPDGAGGAGNAVGALGHLQIYRKDRSTGLLTAYDTGRARVYTPDQDDPGPGGPYRQVTPFDRFHVVYYERLSGGRYLDFVLGFVPDNTDRIVQLDLSCLTLSCEVS